MIPQVSALLPVGIQIIATRLKIYKCVCSRHNTTPGGGAGAPGHRGSFCECGQGCVRSVRVGGVTCVWVHMCTSALKIPVYVIFLSVECVAVLLCVGAVDGCDICRHLVALLCLCVSPAVHATGLYAFVLATQCWSWCSCMQIQLQYRGNRYERRKSNRWWGATRP